MKCTKCNHALPDDSEFCQYCGNRLGTSAVMPEVDAAIVAAETTTASEVPVKNDIEAADSMEMPKQWAGEVLRLQPEMENLEPYKATEPRLSVHAQETIGTINVNRQSQISRGSTMDLKPEAAKPKKVKQPKKKYCSRCGAQIDAESKQCIGCGRKYFKGIKVNKFVATITILSVMIAALIGINIFQYLNNSGIHEELHQKHITIENLEVENENTIKRNEDLVKENKDLEERISELSAQLQSQRITLTQNEQALERFEAEIKEYTPLVRFCKNHVEIIGNDSTNYYHKFGCKYLDMDQGFMVLNTEAAEAQGFTQCPYCRYSQN